MHYGHECAHTYNSTNNSTNNISNNEKKHLAQDRIKYVSFLSNKTQFIILVNKTAAAPQPN